MVSRMSDEHHESVTSRLREEANQELQNAHEKQAMAVAIEEGELTEEQAAEILEMDELAVVQSEYYPGDFYDRAATELRRCI